MKKKAIAVIRGTLHTLIGLVVAIMIWIVAVAWITASPQIQLVSMGVMGVFFVAGMASKGR